MSDRLPILDELARCKSFTAMAEWLGACPLAVFVMCTDEIQQICRTREFGAGAEYAGMIFGSLMANRTRNSPRVVSVMPLFSYRLMAAAKSLDGVPHAR